MREGGGVLDYVERASNCSVNDKNENAHLNDAPCFLGGGGGAGVGRGPIHAVVALVLEHMVVLRLPGTGEGIA